MPWYMPDSWTDLLKKKVCRYLLQRYLGQFLEEKLTLEQLNVDFYNGTGTINNVTLYCQAINELCEDLKWGIEVTGGRIGAITVNIPWNALMTEDSFVEVKDFFIAIRPQPRAKEGISMLESMWSSMSSSMQLAQDCLDKNNEDTGPSIAAQQTTMEGLERFAQTIDNVLNRVKARFTNTEIRLEYLPPNSDCGVALIIKIQNLVYRNEAGSDPPDKDVTNDDNTNKNSNNSNDKYNRPKTFISQFATHHIKMDGITFYTEEFRIVKKHKNIPKNNESLISSNQFYSTISNLPDNEQYLRETPICKAKRDTSEVYMQDVNDDQENISDNDDNNDDNDDDTDADDNQSIIYSSEQILFGKLTAQQEICIKMKQAENIPGPKVELEMTLGAFILFLSPRQLHQLVYLSDNFQNETQIINENIINKRNNDGQQQPQQHQQKSSGGNTQKSNNLGDINLQKQIQSKFSGMTGGIGLNQGWSSEPLEDTLLNLDFQNTLGAQSNRLSNEARFSESFISSNSSMTSSMTSSSISQNTTPRRRGIDYDMESDILHMNIRVACCSIILLHEDVLVECSSSLVGAESPLSEQSVEKLKRLADYFFNSLENFQPGVLDTQKMGKMFSKACCKQHLRLILAPIIVEGHQLRNSTGVLLKFTISIARAELREILQDVSLPLLVFYRDENIHGLPSKPEFLLNYKQTQTAVRGSCGKKLLPPRVDIKISLAQCHGEFDISIIDRLSAIINPSPFNENVSRDTTPNSNLGSTDKLSTQNLRNDIKIEIFFETSLVDVKIRFPIADLRPIHDPQRLPWWSRNVQPDYLLINLVEARIIYYPTITKFDISANEINLYYCENERAQKIYIGKCVPVETTTINYDQIIDYPRVIIEVPSLKKLQLNQENLNQQYQQRSSDDSDSGPNSGERIGITNPKRYESTPFGSKRVCRESDTIHSKETSDNPETLVLPGDRAEMDSFCENAIKLSKLQITINLPVVSLQIKSKHLYEVLYNRINTDLLLWEPSAPCPAPIVTTPNTVLLNVGMMDSIYAPCKSDIIYNSSSDTNSSDDSDSDNDNIFYSIYDRKRSKNLQQFQQQNDGLNGVTFKLNIGQGMLTMYVPVRDSQNLVIPGQLGEFVIKLNNGYVFSVNNVQGNENLGYVCMQSNFIELYHCGLIPIPYNDPPLRFINCLLPCHMKNILYPTPKNLTLIETNGTVTREMFSLALQVKSCPDQRIKRIRVAAGVQMTTLRHMAAQPQHTWLTQLIDMFDVVDYPVQGYSPLSVVTELHLHLWDCSIDYRPLHFPYRAIVTLGTFMISSNIAAASTGCTLRFVAEDGTLCLAPQVPLGECKSNSDNTSKQQTSTSPSASELICVLELGLFEISLRLNEKATPSFPKFDLRAAINGVHIRTCSDSGRALAQLIGYIASEGDLDLGNETTDDNESMLSLGDEDQLFSVKPSTSNIPEVTQSQQLRVNTLMADAMEESMHVCTPIDDDTMITNEQGVEVFFFPDETMQPKRITKLPKSGGQQQQHRKLSESSSLQDDDDDADVELYDKRDYNKINKKPSIDDEQQFLHQLEKEDSESVNTEMRELLDFETSVMGLKSAMDTEVIEALPQVAKELGDISQFTTKQKNYGCVNRKISSDTDEDFCFIADEEKPIYGHQEVSVTEDPIRIIDNHFSVPTGKPDLLKAPQGFPMAVMRYTLCEMSLVWHLYGGHDFPTEEELKQHKSKNRAKNVRTARFKDLPMSEAYKMGVSYSKGTPNVQFGNDAYAKLTWKTRGGPERKHDVLMEFFINKVRFSHETYPTCTEQASRQVLLITELEIRDRLAVSNINKFLYHPLVGYRPTRGSQHMIVIKALHLRPDPSLSAQECCLRVSLLPLRLNIDQDSLLFLVNFFTELGGSGANTSTSSETQATRQQSTPTHQPPIMMVELPEATQELQARKMVSENLMLLMDEDEKDKETIETTSDAGDNAPIYFRNILFSPEVPIRLDYHGKRVELSHGPLAGLLMGLGQLQCSEIRLKRIAYRHGLLGIERLFNFLLQEWLHDIKKNQLPSLLGGVGPMYSFVQLFQGIRDLFWLPIEQYQKDGRIVRGLQRGAQSFTARTALAALEITTRIIHLLQITAETAYDMVSPGPSVRRGRTNRRGRRKRLHPPQDIREGVANAFHIVKEGLGDTAHQIVEVATYEHDQKGYAGACGALVRQIPPTVVRPIVLATQATSNLLGGVKNQLVPDARIEAREKYKDEDE